LHKQARNDGRKAEEEEQNLENNVEGHIE